MLTLGQKRLHHWDGKFFGSVNRNNLNTGIEHIDNSFELYRTLLTHLQQHIQTQLQETDDVSC